MVQRTNYRRGLWQRCGVSALIAAIWVASAAQEVRADPVSEMVGPSSSGIYEATLENGLKVLMKEVRTAPLMCVSVWYRAGTKHESAGTTGLAHLLEHMMFKGTEKYGKGVFDRTLEANGAVNNATTWLDRTNYYVLISADKADLAMELEADLMRNALFAEDDLEDEMPVVRNEMEFGEDDPWTELDERLGSMAILEHPYHWPTIGWKSDVEATTAAQIREYYDRFYHPNNAFLVLVGDLPVESMLKMAIRHFGPIPPGGDPQDPVTVEPPQKGERRFLLREAGSTRLLGIAHRTPAASHPDVPALDMTFRILGSGKSSRLYKALVDSGLAVEVEAYAQVFADPYISPIFVTLAEGADPDEVEARVYEEIARLQTEPPTAAELERALKGARVSHYFSLDQLEPLMFAIGEAEAQGSYRLYEEYLDRLAAVGAESVRDVAKDYLRADARTVGFYLPRGEDGGGWIARPTDDLGAEGRGVLGRPEPNYRTGGSAKSGGMFGLAGQVRQRDEPSVSGMVIHTAKLPKRVELDNGAVLIVQESRENPTVAIRARFGGGLRSEPKGQEGIAALCARTLVRGTKSRTAEELNALMEQSGIKIGLTVGRDAIELNARSLTEDFPLLVELIGEILREPLFDPGQIELARSQQQSRIKSDREDTFLRAYERGLRDLFGRGSPYSRPIRGTEESVASISRHDLQSFHGRLLSEGAWSFAVVGDVDTGVTLDRFQSALGSISREKASADSPPRLIPISGTRGTVQVPLEDKSQVDLVFLGEAVSARASDYPAAFLANVVLGGSFTSRLNGHLRDDEGLTYGAWSDFVDRDGAFYWLANLGVHPDNVQAAQDGVRSVLNKLRSEGLTDEEIDKAREYAAGSFPIQLQSKAQVAGTLIEAERLGFGTNYIAGYGDRLRAVSNEEVRAAVNRFADPERLLVTVSGTFDLSDPSTNEESVEP